MDLVLVTRRGCHLCDDAEAALRELDVEFADVDVDGDPELARLYDFRVPVLLAGGRPVLEGRITVDALRSRLGAAG